MKFNVLKAFLLVVSLFIINPLFAAGDAAAGQQKYVMCIGCHGPQGVSATPTYPTLAGKDADFIRQQLTEFRAGSRQSAIMKPMASGLSNADIDNISAYISTLKP